MLHFYDGNLNRAALRAGAALIKLSRKAPQ